MAVTAFGSVTSGPAGAITSATSHSIPSHVIGSGNSNIALFCGAMIRSASSTTIDSIVWDAAGVNQALTLGSQRTWTSANRIVCVPAWKLSPTEKTADITITASASTDKIQLGARNYHSVHQTTPVGTQNSQASDGATALTGTVTSATGEIVFGTLGIDGNPTDVAVASPGAELWDNSVDTLGVKRSAGGEEAGATSVSMEWTWTGSDDCALETIPIKAAAAYALNLVRFDGANDSLAR